MTTPPIPPNNNRLPILPANTGQQPAGGPLAVQPVPPGGIGYAPNALAADRLYTYGYNVTNFSPEGGNEGGTFVGEAARPFADTAQLMLAAHVSHVGQVRGRFPGFGSSSVTSTYRPRTSNGQSLHNPNTSGFATEVPALIVDGVIETAGPSYLMRDVSIAQSYYPAYIAAVGAAIIQASFEPARALIISNYNSTATQVNNNPTFQNPGAGVAATITTVMGIVTAQAKVLTDTAAMVQAEAMKQAGTVIATATTLAGQVTAAVDTQAKFLLATVGSLTAQADAAVKNAQATIAQQQAIIDAEIKKQQDAATVIVTKALADAGTTIANVTAVVTQVLSTVQAEVARVTTLAIAEATRLQAQINALAADRPLYYGALSSPVTIAGPSDVLVIPAGGLVVTAD